MHSPVIVTFQGDFSVVGSHNPLGNGKPQTGAAVVLCSGLIQTVKTPKYIPELPAERERVGDGPCVRVKAQGYDCTREAGAVRHR